MTKATKKAKKDKPTSISILKMSHDEAREFFLEQDSYFHGIALPPHINFHNVLKKVALYLKGKELPLTARKKAKNFYNINYPFLCNKNSTYEWRKFQLINPALYVSLVNAITTKESWSKIKRRFKSFSKNKQIYCASMPVKSKSKHKNDGEQIIIWLHEIEKESIKLSLDYKYLIKTDIANCYSSIYTHSIAWALHGKKEAKGKRTKEYIDTHIGNKIDDYIQCMNNGQTNGIPEGSALMDFIAEMILGYADSKIFKELNSKLPNESNSDELKIDRYRILRYRDDYRIFVNNTKDGAEIIKIISEVLSDISMRLNTSKTIQSEDLITDSVKADKLSWFNNKQSDSDFYKYLMIIYNHAKKFPDAGGLKRILNKYSKRLERTTGRKVQQHEIPLLISVVTNIACNSPKVSPNCISILSILIDKIIEDNTRIDMIYKITKRFKNLPHSGHIEIWLQTILHPWQKEAKFKESIGSLTFKESICILTTGKNKNLWNNRWISDTKLKGILLSKNIIDTSELKNYKKVLSADVLSIFDSYE